jgi:hypothetical protein
MLTSSHTSEDDICPVGDELLGELYRASELGLPALVATVSADVRAMLALFCYRRSHLEAIGVAIAASCEEDDLVQTGGRLGAVLFAKSREAPNPEPVAPHDTGRRKITLATGALRKMPAMDEGSDEEFGEGSPVVYLA